MPGIRAPCATSYPVSGANLILGKEPITSALVTISPHSAIVIRFLRTALTEVKAAAASPTWRSSSSGNAQRERQHRKQEVDGVADDDEVDPAMPRSSCDRPAVAGGPANHRHLEDESRLIA